MNYLVVNDNAGNRNPGDIIVFRDIQSAEDFMEKIDVDEGNYIALFLDGRFASIVSDRNSIRIEITTDVDLELLDVYLSYAWESRCMNESRPRPSDRSEIAAILSHPSDRL